MGSIKKVKYDVICIGAGSGGLATALAANALGLKVLLVDKNEDGFGGECLHDGCIPSKALLHQSKGTKNFDRSIKEVKNIQSELYKEETPDHLRSLGLEVMVGEAKFQSDNSIMIAGNEYFARKIVIATGSQPRLIEVKNHAKVPVVTNQEIFNIKNPHHVLIIGGGPIGCEMAQAFAQLGVKITLVQRGDQLLDKDEPFAGELIKEKLESLGVEIFFESELSQVDYGGRGHIIPVDCSADEVATAEKLTHPISHVLLSIGRVHNFDGLGLENTSVELGEHGLPIIDEYLTTSVKSIVLAGDATRQPLFSHMAEEHARVLLTNWLSPFSFKKPRLGILPWVTFTDPEVAKFGKTKKRLDKDGLVYRVISGTFDHDDRAYTDQYRNAAYELYVGKTWYGREIMFGGTVVAPGAGELVQELMLLVEQRLSLSAIRNKFYAYPTKSRFWQRVLLEDQERRLVTPKIKKILRTVFRVFN